MSDLDDLPRVTRQSQEDMPTLHEAFTIADAAVEKVAFSTKIQWGAIASIVVSFGVLLGHVLVKMDVVNVAQAETMAKAQKADESGRLNAIRIEAVDSGTRAAVERLEVKLDASEERTTKKLDDVQVTMQAVLKEMRKK